MPDKVRVLRILEYTGEREAIEEHFTRVLYGQKTFEVYTPPGDKRTLGELKRSLGTVTIRVATLGEFPEILKAPDETPI